MGYFYDKVMEMREKGTTIKPKTPVIPVEKPKATPKTVEKPIEKPVEKKGGAKNDKGNTSKS
jgi:hypothetical protein